jgi:methylated-DNA-[protein]-cysteine S-methyltransferase
MENPTLLSMFPTSLGWIGLLGQDRQLISVFVGHSFSKSILQMAIQTGVVDEVVDWNPTARGLFEAYCEGEIVNFSQVDIRIQATTSFRQHVLSATRRIPYGETISYGDLARRVGHPGAARAVGTVMSTNRFPILIPCHRVLAAGGRLGGYTSPAGTGLKQRLLEMEARAIR